MIIQHSEELYLFLTDFMGTPVVEPEGGLIIAQMDDFEMDQILAHFNAGRVIDMIYTCRQQGIPVNVKDVMVCVNDGGELLDYLGFMIHESNAVKFRLFCFST